MNGHKFVARQFYQIMMCAYCSDFLLKASGYQCEDCRYTCHRECYPKVVTKCISKSNAETVRTSNAAIVWITSLCVVPRFRRKLMRIRSIIASPIDSKP